MSPAYEEIVDFIASGPSPQRLMEFRASTTAQDRVADLIQREKEGALGAEEISELEHHLQLEHIMRLAKARARLRIQGINP
jgi:hypothetical protein